ncbi:Protein kinase-like domain [Phytophthora cactorum]|nr:Protein kinase-like domain [Phytophthora cactorum]
MKVFSPRSVGRLVFPALPLVISSVTAADPDTNPSSGSTIIYIVIAVIIILFGIVAFFVWKRKQNRNKRRDDRGYGLPSVTARSGVSRLTSHGNTAFERRMDSTGYSSNSKGNSKSKKGAKPYQSQQQRPHEDQGPGLSMMELQQSQVSSMQSSVEGVHRRQTDPAVIARTQEAAEKVMAELEEDPEFEESWIPYDSLYFTPLRPSFREDCPEQIKALANRCLDADPDARPDAPELLDILRDIQEDLQ